ncbi:hypothetical protein TIFTF001_011307 [Ficus carica]|uniref:Uncharacterized protein n=1 Tax=Ficus carica TaxID=3494 RepID=A0AA88D594_FICCA|nr:hypothetical protein TIFTF001_011307 [Ficus carica]
MYTSIQTHEGRIIQAGHCDGQLVRNIFVLAIPIATDFMARRSSSSLCRGSSDSEQHKYLHLLCVSELLRLTDSDIDQAKEALPQHGESTKDTAEVQQKILSRLLIMGKVPMLDEIINYVQSLQRQVEVQIHFPSLFLQE